jgi:retron-type reverse transcriptase
VLAEGGLLHPQAGTPQGGVISPLLANVYLHALDRVWRERYAKLGQLTRYADDRVTRMRGR